jgi:hypothetical protein
MRRRELRWAAAGALSVVAGLVACGAVLGLGDPQPYAADAAIDVAADGAIVEATSGDDANLEASASADVRPKCGLAPITGQKWNALCQAWNDMYCCKQQEDCAADPVCAKWIACIDECPSPRSDACVNACTPNAAPLDLFNAWGACVRASKPEGGVGLPSGCQWPT